MIASSRSRARRTVRLDARDDGDATRRDATRRFAEDGADRARATSVRVLFVVVSSLCARARGRHGDRKEKRPRGTTVVGRRGVDDADEEWRGDTHR